jgi:hypothetical protein
VKLSAIPKNGYKLREWRLLPSGLPLTGNRYTIGTYNAKIEAVFVELPVNVSVKGLNYKLNHSKKTATVTGLENTKLTKITIPATIKTSGITYKVTAIAANAFLYQSKITTLKIGKNVTTIGKNAFNGCEKMKAVTIQATNLKSVGANAFKGTPKNAVYKCPKGKKDAYKKMLVKKGASKSGSYK